MFKVEYAALAAMLGLAGCASAYDQTAIPNAVAVRKLAVETCASQTDPSVTHAVKVECGIVAERQFAASIKLKDVALLETYVARLRLLAADEDAGKISSADAQLRADEIFKDYTDGIDQEQRLADAQNARVRAGIAAAGAAAAAYSEAQQEAAARQRANTIDCQTTTMGAFTNTHCQ